MEAIYRKIKGKISLTARSRSNDLIIVTYQGGDPVINFKIVDSLVSNFMEESLQSSRGRGR